MFEGTWAVVYDDDTVLTQKDEQHPEYRAEAHEVPFRCIEWGRVRRVLFHSADAVGEFNVQPTPDWDVALRSRVFMSKSGTGIRAFLLTVSVPGEEVSDVSAKRVLYWFPNGIVHECPHFNCPAVSQYALTWVHGLQGGLTPIHEVISTEVDAALAAPVTR